MDANGNHEWTRTDTNESAEDYDSVPAADGTHLERCLACEADGVATPGELPSLAAPWLSAEPAVLSCPQ